MSFLSLAFLAALPLAAVPILLHLFDRRRNVVIEWGAMEFLLEAASQKTAARKLKQWLLVLLRVLAVLLLVFALARPTLPGHWFGTALRSETIFILDNSMSMTRGADDGSRFDEAVKRISDSLETLHDGDSVRILLASPYPIWLTAGSVRVDPGSRERLAAQLQEIESTNSGSDLLSALFTAVQARRPAVSSRRRIVLLTDGQASDWHRDDEAGWRRIREVLRAASLPTNLKIVELSQKGTSNRDNLAVNEIRSDRLVVGVNQPFTLSAQIQNYGDSTSSPSGAAWSVAGAEAGESLVPALEGGAVHEVLWKHSFSQTGTYALSCTLEADEVLAADNRATIVIEVVDQVPFLLVEGAPDLVEMQRDAFFVQAALGWIGAEPLEGRSVLRPRLISPDRLSQADLSGERAVVIPNLTSLDEVAVRRLREFVFAGGGLWIALGPRTDAEAFQHLFAEGNSLAPLAIERIQDESPAEPTDAEAERQTKIDPFRNDHPATTHLADTEKLDTGDVSVFRHWKFTPAAEGEDVSTLLRLTNGEPLAVEKYYGQGRVIVQAIPLRLQWSDLARSQAFVVMVRDWLAYLTGPKATLHNLSPGDPIHLKLAHGDMQHATLRTPQGDEIELAPDVRDDGTVLQSGRTVLPGDYWIELGTSGTRIPFHVNRTTRESDLSVLAKADRDQLAALTDVPRDPAQTALRATSEPLWPLLLMVLIALIASELFLSGLISRERFGSDPIDETSESSRGAGPDTVHPNEPLAEPRKDAVRRAVMADAEP